MLGPASLLTSPPRLPSSRPLLASPPRLLSCTPTVALGYCIGSTSKCLCGAWSGGDLRYTFWSTSASKWSFIFHGKNTADPQYGTGLDEDRERHTVVMDMKNQQMSVVTGGVTNWTKTATAGTFNATDESSYPMGLFGYVNNASGTSSEMLAKARVYSVSSYFYFRICRRSFHGAAPKGPETAGPRGVLLLARPSPAGSSV